MIHIKVVLLIRLGIENGKFNVSGLSMSIMYKTSKM